MRGNWFLVLWITKALYVIFEYIYTEYNPSVKLFYLGTLQTIAC